MNALLSYLNAMPPPEQVRFATDCQTTVGYLRKACSVGSPLRELLCSRIEMRSGGVVSRPVLRPDDWHEIWPELIPVYGLPTPPAPGPAAGEGACA